MSAFPCGKITHRFLAVAGLVLIAATAQAGSYDHVSNGELAAAGAYQGEPVLELLDFNSDDVYAQDLSAIDGNIVGPQAFLLANHGMREWNDEILAITVNGTEGLLPFLASGTPERFPPFAKMDGIALLAFVVEGKEASVPEPTTWLVLATGLVLLCFARLAPTANPARRARSYIEWRWRWRWPWRKRSRSRSRWPGRVR